MKSLRVISILVLCFSLTAGAQTNAPTVFSGVSNVLSAVGVPEGISGGAADTLGYLIDATPYIANGDFLFEAGALKNGTNWGMMFDVQLPINTNNWQLTYGICAAYLNKQFYSAALNVKVGTTVNVPYLSKFTGPFYVHAESGPGVNMRTGAGVVQSFIGIEYAHLFSKTISAGVSVNDGIISSVPGQVQAYTGFLTCHL